MRLTEEILNLYSSTFIIGAYLTNVNLFVSGFVIFVRPAKFMLYEDDGDRYNSSRRHDWVWGWCDAIESVGVQAMSSREHILQKNTCIIIYSALHKPSSASTPSRTPRTHCRQEFWQRSPGSYLFDQGLS
jgi:hypothetical protein